MPVFPLSQLNMAMKSVSATSQIFCWQDVWVIHRFDPGQSMLGTVEKILELMDYTQDLDRLTELNRQQIARSNRA